MSDRTRTERHVSATKAITRLELVKTSQEIKEHKQGRKSLDKYLRRHNKSMIDHYAVYG